MSILRRAPLDARAPRRGGGIRRSSSAVPVLVIAVAVLAVGAVRLFDLPYSELSPGSGTLAEYAGILLAAISILFAIAFADARYWPTLAELAWLCWIPQFLITSGVAALATWLVPTLDLAGAQLLPDLLWVGTAILGGVSVAKTIRLSSAKPLNDVMSSRLREGMEGMHPGAARAKRSRSVHDVDNFSRAVHESLADNDALMLRDLSDQFQAARAASPPAHQSEYSHLGARLAQSAGVAGLFRELDGATTARTLHKLLEHPELAVEDPSSGTDALALRLEHIEITAPLLSRLETQCRLLGAAGHAALVDVLEVRRAALELLAKEAEWFDPSPKQMMRRRAAAAEHDWTPERALRCYRWLTVRPTPDSASSTYALYQHVSGQRYTGNYWTGSPIIRDICEHLGPALQDRLLDVLAEQVITCTTSLHQRAGGPTTWHSQDDTRTTRSLLRTIHPLTAPQGTAAAIWELQRRVARSAPTFFSPTALLPVPTVRELSVGHATVIGLTLPPGEPGTVAEGTLLPYLDALPEDLGARTRALLHRLTGADSTDELVAVLAEERDYAVADHP